jgi:hypothetical protein
MPSNLSLALGTASVSPMARIAIVSTTPGSRNRRASDGVLYRRRSCSTFFRTAATTRGSPLGQKLIVA